MQHHAAGFAQALGHCRHRISVVLPCWPEVVFTQRNVSKRAVLRGQTNIAKLLAAQQLSVGIMLDINRQGFGIAAIAASSQ